MLDTLEQLKRSGRVSWLKSSLGSLLKIKLFLEVQEGSVMRLGEARTRGKAIQRLHEMLSEIGPLEQLAVLHTNALEDANKIAETFISQVSSAPLIRNVTTVIGTHVGVNALGFVVLRAK
jgi:DegV family protein with EDD domain